MYLFGYVRCCSISLLHKGCPLACGILVPRPGIEPAFPSLQGGFLTTGHLGSPTSVILAEPAAWRWDYGPSAPRVLWGLWCHRQREPWTSPCHLLSGPRWIQVLSGALLFQSGKCACRMDGLWGWTFWAFFSLGPSPDPPPGEPTWHAGLDPCEPGSWGDTGPERKILWTAWQ